MKLRGYNPVRKADDVAINELIGLIEQAKKPLIYCGGGIITGDAPEELAEFAERTQIPVTTTLMGIGGFPENHPLSLKWLGMHGTVYANNAANEADLLLAIGVRFDDRVTGKVEKFCEHGTIVHIDIDNSELNKNKLVKLPILSDLKYALDARIAILGKDGTRRLSNGYTAFRSGISRSTLESEYPLRFKDTDDAIQPQYASNASMS